jgi:hypothetical protein
VAASLLWLLPPTNRPRPHPNGHGIAVYEFDNSYSMGELGRRPDSDMLITS